MKLVSLNCYTGRVHDAFVDFIQSNQDADVICLQEVLSAGPDVELVTDKGSRTHLFQEVLELLPDHDGHFAPCQTGFNLTERVDEEVNFGVAVFWKKSLTVTQKKDFIIYGERNKLVGKDWSTLPMNALAVSFETTNGPVAVCSVHGTSEPTHKRDSEERLKQSQIIIDEMNSFDGQKIIMGDFNLFPDTDSIRMFENAGYRNLINDFGITNTRGSLIKELFPHYGDTELGWQDYADFTFVTPDVQINSFKVPDLPISDHLPMILEIK